MRICLSREIDKTQKLFSLVKTKLSISVLTSISAKSAAIEDLQENLLAALYLQTKTYQTSKLNSRIQAIH